MDCCDRGVGKEFGMRHVGVSSSLIELNLHVCSKKGDEKNIPERFHGHALEGGKKTSEQGERKGGKSFIDPASAERSKFHERGCQSGKGA